MKLYNKDSKGVIRFVDIKLSGNMIFISHGSVDTFKTRLRPIEVFGKNIGKSNETTNEQQAKLEFDRRVNKYLDKGYKTNIDEVDKEFIFKPMLASKLKLNKTYNKVHLQPKLDGVRCIAFIEDGEVVLQSRSGKKFSGLDHVRNCLKPNLKEGMYLDGELYRNSVSFSDIISAVKLGDPYESLNLVLYDCLDLGKLNSIYSERYGELINFKSKYVKIIENSFKDVLSHNDIQLLLNHYTNNLYEGLIIRLDEAYEMKRSKNLIKVKSTMSDEFKITGVLEGRGTRSDIAGSVTFVTSKGSIFAASVKGSHDNAKKLLENEDNIIGKMGTVEFFEYTDNEVPRFPVFVGVRDYE